MNKTLFIAIIFVLSSAQASDTPCPWDEVLEQFQHEDILNQEVICSKLPPIKTEKDLKDVIEFYFSKAQKSDDPDRHVATKKLNRCKPTKNSKTLVIAFEGTGAYEPLIPATMARFNKCFGGKVPKKLKNKIYSSTREVFKAKKGKDSKWSGLQSGVMQEMITMDGGRSADWYSFPSEEVEQLAGLEEIKGFSLKQLRDSIKDSVNSNPKGIKNARDCIMQYMREAKLLGVEPKIVLTSHSSGGRSLVKFAEHMKKDVGVDVDLAFSIDPVKEAHHAIEEVVPQKIGEPARYLKWKITSGKGSDYPYSAVWHRAQPKKLYKPSNVKDHQNFYQLDDRLGLKMGGDALRFGIQGSSMDGADNTHIKGLSSSGHGEVTYDSKVLKSFQDKFSPLLK